MDIGKVRSFYPVTSAASCAGRIPYSPHFMKLIIGSKTDTKKLAKKISGQLRGGEIIGLIGQLGAGKTTFIQYLAKALGVKNTVNSPTFNILKIYLARFPNSEIRNLVHVDAYRLRSADELTALGAQEYFERNDTITIIEWADKVKKILPKKAMVINIKIKSKNERVFEIK